MRAWPKALGIALLAVVWHSGAAAADVQAPAASAITAPAAPKLDAGADSASLERRVETYVRAITRHAGSDDGLQVRWNTPICPLLLGFNDVKSFQERLSQISTSVGAPLAKAPCQPNFVIVATAEPDQVLKAWYARDKRLFRDATPVQIRQFMESSQSRPIRVWYNIDTGRKSGVHNGHFVPSNTEAESSVFAGNTVFDFFSIFEIIDTHKTEGITLAELTAYAALVGLSNVDLDADLGGAPSILRLFAPGEKPPDLSGWDLSFLKALYQSNQNSRTRRFDITERVVHDLSR